MSLDVHLMQIKPTKIFSRNITHNLAPMATEAGIYQHLWRPEELGIERAEQLIIPLTAGLKLLRDEPERFKKLNPANEWGDYYGLCKFVEKYLAACCETPEAMIQISR